MSEQYKGSYAPELFNEEKRYYLVQAQQLGKLTDAELRDLHLISNTQLRRFIQSQLGDCSINDGFCIAENPSDNTNNFTIKGGDGTLDNPGVFFLNGYRLILRNDITYKDQTDTGSLTDDAYTKAIFPSLTVPVGTTGNLTSLAIRNDSTILACGDDIVRTGNGGRDWTFVRSANLDLNTISQSGLKSYAFGLDGAAYGSVDSGQSWASINLPGDYTSVDFYGSTFYATNTGWIVGESGSILYTISAGSSWSPQTPGVTSEILRAIDTPDAVHVWAAGDSGTIIYTGDGLNWHTQLSGVTSTLRGVKALPADSVYVVGDTGTILKTDNSGVTWVQKQSDTTENLYGVDFPTSSIGYAVGSGGIITATSDSGASWDATKIANVDLQSVKFIDATTGFIVGANGTILRTLDGSTWDNYRTDYVYIDMHLAEVTADSTLGSEYFDASLQDASVGLPGANRLRLVADVRVSEGWPAPADYVSSGSVEHKTFPLAKIQRHIAQQIILQSDITDLRPVVRTISQLDSALTSGGVDSSSLAAGSVTAEKINPAGTFIFDNLQVTHDATIQGGLTVNGPLHVTDFTSSTSVESLRVNGFTVLGDSTRPYDDPTTIYGPITQYVDSTTAYAIRSSADTSASPVFDVVSEGTGPVFKVRKTSDSTNCVYEVTSYGKGYDFCVSHLGSAGGVLNARDDGSGNTVYIVKDATGFVGSVLNLSAATSDPIAKFLNRSTSADAVTIRVDQTSGVMIRLNTPSNASGISITSSGSGSDLKIAHSGSTGIPVDVTSSSTNGAIHLNNLSGQAVHIGQKASATSMLIDHDATNGGRGLDINYKANDTGFQVSADGKNSEALHVNHTGDGTKAAVHIHVAGDERGPALFINKANSDDTRDIGPAISILNQSYGPSLYIQQNNVDASWAGIVLNNTSKGLDFSSSKWKIDTTGNLTTSGIVSSPRLSFDQTNYFTASSGQLDYTHYDASNPGVSGRLYHDYGFLRISDGTNTQPMPFGGVTGPQGETGLQGPAGGPQGATGLRGPTGIQGPAGGPQGVTGLVGSRGATGIQGLRGPQGPAALPAKIPSGYVSLDGTSKYSSSTTFTQVLATTVTLEAEAYIYGSMSFSSDSTGIGSYPIAACRIVIADSSGTELPRYIRSDDDSEVGNVEHRAGPYAAGTYTVQGQLRRASGTKVVRIREAQLFAEGLIGAKGDAGNTGLRGETGLMGVAGIRGATGVQGIGITGPRGVTGPAGPESDPGELPNDYSVITIPVDTTSSVYVNVPGLSGTVTLDTSSAIFASYSFEAVSQGSGTEDYITGGFRVVIADSSGTELTRFILSDDDVSIGNVTHRTPVLPPGEYTAFAQYRLVDGESALRINSAQLFVQGQQGARGNTGTTGLRGLTGIQGVTGPFGGPAGATGPQGVTGPFGGPKGETGAQGITGLIGETGLQGAIGPIGPAGATGAQGIIGATGLEGAIGPAGATGAQGVTGYGLQGVTGLVGPVGPIGMTGAQGITGYGLQGVTGLVGPVGPVGLTGAQGNTGLGVQGVTGLVGPVGPVGMTGAQGSTGLGLQGITGLTGNTGLIGATGIGIVGPIGATGLQGATGLSGGPISFFNTVSRYSAETASGEEVWIVSSSTVYTEVSWTRAGTVLTVNRDNHGHTSGDRVVVRNTNMDYQVATIDSTSTNSFQITTSDTGALLGGAGAYSLGFKFEHVGNPKTGGILSAPTGDHADVQLISVRLRTGARSGSTYDLAVPASAINGAGANSSLADCFIPDFNVRFDADNLSAVAATMVVNNGGAGYSTFQFGNLGTLSRMILLHF